MNNEIYHILNDMAEHLNIAQMKKLQEVLIKRLEETEEEVTTSHLLKICCLGFKYLFGK